MGKSPPVSFNLDKGGMLASVNSGKANHYYGALHSSNREIAGYPLLKCAVIISKCAVIASKTGWRVVLFKEQVGEGGKGGRACKLGHRQRKPGLNLEDAEADIMGCKPDVASLSF
jgi:hypothetical protein